jgi:hypothetical protein
VQEDAKRGSSRGEGGSMERWLRCCATFCVGMTLEWSVLVSVVSNWNHTLCSRFCLCISW